jgi:hypothetical protein
MKYGTKGDDVHPRKAITAAWPDNPTFATRNFEYAGPTSMQVINVH